MANRRTLDEHIVLFTAYAARVSALSAPAWSRLEERCADLDGPSFAALLARAGLTAKSRELWIPEGAGVNRQMFSALKRVSGLVQHGFAFGAEVVAEFGTPGASAAHPPHSDPRVAKLAAASGQLDSALESRAEKHPGVVAAVRAAGQAVLRHDWLTSEAFAALYQYVEAEIPFVSLESPPP